MNTPTPAELAAEIRRLADTLADCYTTDVGRNHRSPWVRTDLHKVIARLEAAAQQAAPAEPVAMPLLSSAFRTTESGPGRHLMVFKFQNLADMQAADNEWRSYAERVHMVGGQVSEGDSSGRSDLRSSGDRVRDALCAGGVAPAQPVQGEPVATLCVRNYDDAKTYGFGLPRRADGSYLWETLPVGDYSVYLAAPAAPAGPMLTDAEDTERLDWLADQAKKSRTGLTLSYTRPFDGEGGYRVMRYHSMGEFHPTGRAAIDAARTLHGEGSGR